MPSQFAILAQHHDVVVTIARTCDETEKGYTIMRQVKIHDIENNATFSCTLRKYTVTLFKRQCKQVSPQTVYMVVVLV